MTNEVLSIILSGVGVIVSGLCTWLVAVLPKWFNSKIKDKKIAGYLSQITTICTNAVKSVYQTYVESIKGTSEWNKETQEKALNQALASAMFQMSDELIEFIKTNYGDITTYLKQLIESILYTLKNNK